MVYENLKKMGEHLKNKGQTKFKSWGTKAKENLKANWKSYAEQKKKEREAYRESYKTARIHRMHVEGRAAAYGKQSPYAPKNTSYSWIEPFSMTQNKPKTYHKKKQHQQYVVVGGKAYHVAGSGKRHHKKKQTQHNPWDFNFQL